jgi:hypothetical protein
LILDRGLESQRDIVAHGGHGDRRLRGVGDRRPPCRDAIHDCRQVVVGQALCLIQAALDELTDARAGVADVDGESE